MSNDILASSPKQPTKPSCKAFDRLNGKYWELIPLNKWNAEKTRHGRTRKTGKAPFHFNWTKREYDRKQVRAQVEQGHNFGHRIKRGQLVLDIDPRNGGEQGFKDLCRELGEDFKGYCRHVTGSGGWHIFMTVPESFKAVDTIEGFPGVEFKGHGRQVVMPGSIHPDTRKFYAVEDDHDPSKPAPKRLLRLVKRPVREGTTAGGEFEPHDIAKRLELLDPCDFSDHSAWLNLMMSAHHATAGEARAEFVDWSTGDPQYAGDADVIGRRWDSLHKDKDDGVSYKSFNKALRDKGHGDAQLVADVADDAFPDDADDSDSGFELADRQEMDAADVQSRGLVVKNNAAPDNYPNALSAVVRSGLRPEWNELKGQVVFRQPDLPWDPTYGRILTDHVERMIRLYIIGRFQGVAYSPSRENLHEALMTSAYSAKFNPVLEYVDSLKWDGVKRIERLFPKYFGCEDDAFTRAASQCFMVAALRRMREPGCKFDTSVILKGRQGVGKSSGFKALFGADWFSDAELGDLKGKDAAMGLRGIWCHEFSELGAMSNAASETLKAFLSRATDRIREPYGRNVEDAPRRCVLVGTTNESGYLRDGTGARRFWPMEVQREIDVAKIVADRDQLWAEAAVLEASGASVVLPRDLWDIAATRQDAATEDDPWTDTLANFLTSRREEWDQYVADDFEDSSEGRPAPPDRVLISELFDALDIAERDRTRQKAQRLRTVMEARLGWQHAKTTMRVFSKTGKGYVAKAG